MPDDAQIEFFPPEDLTESELLSPEVRGKIVDEESRGKYTALRLKKKKPEVYKAIVTLLGASTPMTRISEICGVHFYTVAAVSRESSADIEKIRANLSSGAFVTAQILQEKVMEMAAGIDPANTDPGKIYQLTTAMAVLIDKGNLLSGGVTERMGFEEPTVPFNGDMEKYAQEYLKKNSTDVEAEIVKE